MSDMIGMDVEAVRRTASELRRKANEIRAVEARVDAIVGQISAGWQGIRARQFVGDWHGHHRAALLLLADRVDGLGQSALNNANEQVSASSAGARPGGGGHAGGRAGFWDKGAGGVLAGVWGGAADVAGDVGGLVSMAWDGDRRRDFVGGLGYAIRHPGELWDVLWAEATAEEDRENGRYAVATGRIAFEVATLSGVPLKLAKMRKLAKANDAAAAAKRARITQRAAADSQAAVRARLYAHPRWRTEETPWHPTGAAPGRWADPEEFRRVVVDPADKTALKTQLRALDRERDFRGAQQSYERWSAFELRGRNAAIVEKAADAGDAVVQMNDPAKRQSSSSRRMPGPVGWEPRCDADFR